jgi:hypothetical protein
MASSPSFHLPSTFRAQATQFGTSSFLQSTDFQVKGDIEPAHDSYTLGNNQLTFSLNAATTKQITVAANQFRLTLDAGSFSNFNGVSL